MACRAPVVASATGGIKEVVVDGETGYLVPFDQDPATSFPRNPEKFARDLAARIDELLDDPEKCRRFGDAGRQRVEEIFSWTAIAHQTIRSLRAVDRAAKTRRQLLQAAGRMWSTRCQFNMPEFANGSRNDMAVTRSRWTQARRD